MSDELIWFDAVPLLIELEVEEVLTPHFEQRCRTDYPTETDRFHSSSHCRVGAPPQPKLIFSK